LLNKLQPRSALPASGEEGERKAGPIEDRYRTVFRQTMMNDLDQLRQALEQGRAEAIARLLHRMRGALVVVGWTDQARELGVLEDALKGAEDEAAILDKVRRAQEALRAQVDLV
jgi:two-component system capsular synthesis sensor histidine kinase RcsC